MHFDNVKQKQLYWYKCKDNLRPVSDKFIFQIFYAVNEILYNLWKQESSLDFMSYELSYLLFLWFQVLQDTKTFCVCSVQHWWN